MTKPSTPFEAYRGSEPIVATPPSLLSRVSWGAIFAGVAIAVGLTILMGLLGTAIGFRAIDPMSSSPFSGIGIGTAVWWILTSVISLCVGGYVAGVLSGQFDRSAAAAHGASAWGIVTIITLWMAVSAIGTAVNTATSAVATIAKAGTQVIGTVGGAVLPDNINVSPQVQQVRQQVIQEAEQVLAQADIGDEQLAQAQAEVGTAAANIARRPGQLDEEVSSLIDRLFEGSDAVFSQSDRQELVEAISERAGMTTQEAQTVVQRWEAQAQNAGNTIEKAASDVRQTAGETSETALDALSSASWYAFFASLLSLLAAMGAAVVGVPQRRTHSDVVV